VVADQSRARDELIRLTDAAPLAESNARSDGRRDAAYPGQRTATVPEDLERELAAHPRAKAFFGTLDAGNRFVILHRIREARKPETRARRIDRFVAMLEAGEKPSP
jgi:uncharacterized protein YdeI (YjbR/CyaY-like superfamily)